MRAILSLIEDRIEHQPKTMRLTSDISDSMSTSQIIDRMSALDPNGPTGVQSVIRGAFVQSCAVPMGVEASGTWSSTSQNTPYLVSELCERMAYTDDQSHLTSLRKEDDAAFDKKKKFAWISKVDTNSSYSAKGNEAWQVDFFACHLALKQAMAYAIVGHKLGKETVRVMRILDTHGRLEEKHVSVILDLPQFTAQKVCHNRSKRLLSLAPRNLGGMSTFSCKLVSSNHKKCPRRRTVCLQGHSISGMSIGRKWRRLYKAPFFNSWPTFASAVEPRRFVSSG